MQGLALLTELERNYDTSALVPYQPLAVARAYLLVMNGSTQAALTSYTHALTLTQRAGQRDYLQARINSLQL